MRTIVLILSALLVAACTLNPAEGIGNIKQAEGANGYRWASHDQGGNSNNMITFNTDPNDPWCPRFMAPNNTRHWECIFLAPEGDQQIGDIGATFKTEFVLNAGQIGWEYFIPDETIPPVGCSQVTNVAVWASVQRAGAAVNDPGLQMCIRRLGHTTCQNYGLSYATVGSQLWAAIQFTRDPATGQPWTLDAFGQNWTEAQDYRIGVVHSPAVPANNTFFMGTVFSIVNCN